GVLPNAILADIAEHDALQTGQPKEGMYFAARTLMQKFGQTFGIFVFAMLTTLGKDPGDDLGIRLSGLFGFVLCLLAGLLFIRYNERQLLQEIEQLNKG
ncbi:MAG: MFS transporter, partial [Anaerolineales bacterium]|nr:MFS transporter [Anaerolineales bacterium]